LGGDFPEPDAAGTALLGLSLEPYERREHRLAEGIRQPQSDPRGKDEANHREADANEEEDGIPARVRAI
jgi:hypothetical protein